MRTLSCDKQDLVLQPGIKPRPPTLRAWSLTHWTTWEVPIYIFNTDLLWLHYKYTGIFCSSTKKCAFSHFPWSAWLFDLSFIVILILEIWVQRSSSQLQHWQWFRSKTKSHTQTQYWGGVGRAWPERGSHWHQVGMQPQCCQSFRCFQKSQKTEFLYVASMLAQKSIVQVLKFSLPV